MSTRQKSRAAASWKMSVGHAGSDLRVVGFRAVEGTPAFGKTLPFAGRRGNEGLGRFNEDEGSIQPSGRRIDDGVNEGCSSCSDEEGNPAYTVLRQQVGPKGDPLLGVTRPAQSSAFVQRLPPQAVVGSRRRPQAASRWGGSFRHRNLRRACSAVERRRKGCRGSRLFATLLREGEVVAPSGRQEARASSDSLRTSRRGGLGKRENWALEGVSVFRKSKLQKSVGGSRAQRSACRRLAKQSRSVTMRGDGSLAQGNHVPSESDAHGAVGERAPRVGSQWKRSRDRLRGR